MCSVTPASRGSPTRSDDALASDGWGVETTSASLARWGYDLYGGFVLSNASLHEMTDFQGRWYGLGVMDFSADYGTLAMGHDGTSSVTTCCSVIRLVALPRGRDGHRPAGDRRELGLGSVDTRDTGLEGRRSGLADRPGESGERGRWGQAPGAQPSPHEQHRWGGFFGESEASRTEPFVMPPRRQTDDEQTGVAARLQHRLLAGGDQQWLG